MIILTVRSTFAECPCAESSTTTSTFAFTRASALSRQFAVIPVSYTHLDVYKRQIQYQIDANYLPDGWRSYMAKAVKERYGKPCMTMGNIRNPQVAEDILARGDADLIGMGRGLIADPEWVNKVEFGDECDIRKCISCNIGCAGHRIGINRPIRCTVNPSVNGGEDYKKQKINKPCNVVVRCV